MATSQLGADMFTRLPPELIHTICAYLFPTHNLRKSINDEPWSGDEDEASDTPRSHPLDYLAATCKYLHAEVNEWALHFLIQHKDITKYKPPKSLQRGVKRNLLRRGRPGLLTWSQRCCVFCGKKSKRSAILMNGIRCCIKCDKREWPDKITKTRAKVEFHLQDHHLQAPEPRPPLQNRMCYPRFGQYFVYNVVTTMFLRSDLEKLARQIHGVHASFPWSKESSAAQHKLQDSSQMPNAAVRQDAALRAKTVAVLGESARNANLADAQSPESLESPTTPSTKKPKFKGYKPAPILPISPPSQMSHVLSTPYDYSEVSDFHDLFGNDQLRAATPVTYDLA